MFRPFIICVFDLSCDHVFDGLPETSSNQTREVFIFQYSCNHQLSGV